jgi:uncharacterized protein
MKPDLVAGVKLLLLNRFPELEYLDISWFGGEPLIASDIVYDIMTHVRDLRESASHVAVSSDMTTNGYLLAPAAARRLLSLGVTRFQISLDGSAATHDPVRKRADGSGTFATIWTNLLHLGALEEPYEVVIRIHASPSNEGSIRELLLACRDAFGGDPRFRFLIRPVAKLGGPNDREFRVLSPADAARAMESLAGYARRLGLETQAPSQPICYAARPNSWIIRSDGALGKCTVALSDDRNRVGRLLPDGTLRIRGPKVAPWIRGMATGSPAELACPLEGLAPTAAPEYASRIQEPAGKLVPVAPAFI